MKAVVVGSGGWGTALSMVLCDNGHDVTLWSHDPAKAVEMTKTRENSKLKGVRLPDSLKISGDLDRRPFWSVFPRASSGIRTSA